VIAIIAILAAILFPVFAQARESARATSCLSNSKQVALAQMMYGQDYDESIVPWRACNRRVTTTGIPSSCPTAAEAAPTIWTFLLEPYLKSYSIYFCPSFSASGTAKAMDQADCDGDGSANSGANGYIPGLGTAPNYGAGPGYMSHYGIAFAITGGTGDSPSDPLYDFPGSGWVGNPSTFQGRSFASIVEPARSTNISDGITVWLSTADAIGTAMGCEARYRHKGESGGNFSFVDGHSKYLKGNSQRYVQQGADGKWFMTYHTANR
jgi:prepilin-type processing-associated H-X9-DG protein